MTLTKTTLSKSQTCLMQNEPKLAHLSGPAGSKLLMSLVNVLLNFQTSISRICQYFLLKKCEKAFELQKLLSFFQQKISVFLVIKS